MRVYRADGSFVEDENDTEFGWYCGEIVIDESRPHYRERNRETRELSRLCKSLDKSAFVASPSDSLDVPDSAHASERPRAADVVVELLAAQPASRRPSLPAPPEAERDRLAARIVPCGAEARALLSVVCGAGRARLARLGAASALLGGANARATSPRRVLLGDGCAGPLGAESVCAASLMTELIADGAGCTAVDLEGTRCAETDVWNGTRGASSSTSASSSPRLLRVQPKERSDVLGSLGLGEEDRSIRSICEETHEMHKELVAIRRSFQEMECRVATLQRAASELRDELTEVLYLEDIIRLLEGDVDSVRLKKLPFRAFHGESDETDLIV